MGLPAAFIASIDRMGLRRVSASVASLVYGVATVGRQSFSIDADGRWRNHEPEATIASPTVHTTSYAAFRDWVIDNWCWAYRPLPGDTVVDVGAGIGEEAVVFSHLVGPTGHVISIEAHPETFACLKETVRLSKLTNVTPLQIALGERDGVTMIASGKSHLTSSVVRGGAGVQVPLRSLDSLAGELGLRDIALLKMNIEGAERLAVKGMRSTSSIIRNLCISCHDFLSERGEGEELRTKADVRPELERYGFALTDRPNHPSPWVRDYLYGTKAEQAGSKA
jgi:FkbM family methyltransferase